MFYPELRLRVMLAEQSRNHSKPNLPLTKNLLWFSLKAGLFYELLFIKFTGFGFLHPFAGIYKNFHPRADFIV